MNIIYLLKPIAGYFPEWFINYKIVELVLSIVGL